MSDEMVLLKDCTCLFVLDCAKIFESDVEINYKVKFLTHSLFFI